MEKTKQRAAWRGAFLRALKTSGSVKMAAEAAGIDRTSAYAMRKRDAAFAADWARAATDGQGRIAAGTVPRLRADEVVRASRHGRPCVARAGPGRWSAGAEARFLAELATDCNVSRAAAAAGVSTTAVYKRRRDWPGFAEAWAAALEQGYARLKCLLVQVATATLAGGEAAAATGAPPSFGEAMNLFRLHRHGVTGEGRRPGGAWRRVEPTIEEVRAEVLRRVRAIKGTGVGGPASEG